MKIRIALLLLLSLPLSMNAPAHAQSAPAPQAPPGTTPSAPSGATPDAPSGSASPNTRNPDWAVPLNASMNLHRISPTLYRSAQLTKADLPTLSRHGIKTVLSLRAFHNDDELLKDSKITAVRVPFYTWDIDDEEVIGALRAIRIAEANGAVLLHCQHGADRTGLISAMYRILYQGWERERALDELRNGSYGYHSIWANIPRYLRNVDIEKIRAAVEKDLPTPATPLKAG